MERFKVSGQDLRNFYGENISLERVFHDIETDLRATNQVVCRYIVNGLEVSEAQEQKFSTVKLDEVQTLEYLTENSRDITVLVLKGWIEALPELISKTEHLAKRMRIQGFSGLMKSIHDLVQNCEFLIDSTINLKMTMGDQFFGAGPVDWYKTEQESRKTVEEALRALENKDFVLLADVLEYDLNNVLQMWLEHLRVLEKSLNGERGEFNSYSEKAGPDPVGRKRLAN